MTVLKKSVTLNPGESKAVGFEFTPTEARIHEVSVDGLVGSFNVIEVIPGGEILEITSWDEENEIWHPITDPIPEYEEITHRFRVKNTGSAAKFKIGYCYWSSFQQRWVWTYSPSFDIEPGEGNIDWLVYTGGAGTFSVTFHLFSDDTEVDSMTTTITVR